MHVAWIHISVYACVCTDSNMHVALFAKYVEFCTYVDINVYMCVCKDSLMYVCMHVCSSNGWLAVYD